MDMVLYCTARKRNWFEPERLVDDSARALHITARNLPWKMSLATEAAAGKQRAILRTGQYAGEVAPGNS